MIDEFNQLVKSLKGSPDKVYRRQALATWLRENGSRLEESGVGTETLKTLRRQLSPETPQDHSPGVLSQGANAAWDLGTGMWQIPAQAAVAGIDRARGGLDDVQKTLAFGRQERGFETQAKQMTVAKRGGDWASTYEDPDEDIRDVKNAASILASLGLGVSDLALGALRMPFSAIDGQQGPSVAEQGKTLLTQGLVDPIVHPIKEYGGAALEGPDALQQKINERYVSGDIFGDAAGAHMLGTGAGFVGRKAIGIRDMMRKPPPPVETPPMGTLGDAIRMAAKPSGMPEAMRIKGELDRVLEKEAAEARGEYEARDPRRAERAAADEAIGAVEKSDALNRALDAELLEMKGDPLARPIRPNEFPAPLEDTARTQKIKDYEAARAERDAGRPAEIDAAYGQRAQQMKDSTREYWRENTPGRTPADPQIPGAELPTREPVRPPASPDPSRITPGLDVGRLPFAEARTLALEALKGYPAKATRAARRSLRRLTEKPGWQDKLADLTKIGAVGAVATTALAEYFQEDQDGQRFLADGMAPAMLLLGAVGAGMGRGAKGKIAEAVAAEGVPGLGAEVTPTPKPPKAPKKRGWREKAIGENKRILDERIDALGDHIAALGDAATPQLEAIGRDVFNRSREGKEVAAAEVARVEQMILDARKKAPAATSSPTNTSAALEAASLGEPAGPSQSQPAGGPGAPSPSAGMAAMGAAKRKTFVKGSAPTGEVLQGGAKKIHDLVTDNLLDTSGVNPAPVAGMFRKGITAIATRFLEPTSTKWFSESGVQDLLLQVEQKSRVIYDGFIEHLGVSRKAWQDAHRIMERAPEAWDIVRKEIEGEALTPEEMQIRQDPTLGPIIDHVVPRWKEFAQGVDFLVDSKVDTYFPRMFSNEMNQLLGRDYRLGQSRATSITPRMNPFTVMDTYARAASNAATKRAGVKTLETLRDAYREKGQSSLAGTVDQVLKSKFYNEPNAFDRMWGNIASDTMRETVAAWKPGDVVESAGKFGLPAGNFKIIRKVGEGARGTNFEVEYNGRKWGNYLTAAELAVMDAGSAPRWNLKKKGLLEQRPTAKLISTVGRLAAFRVIAGSLRTAMAQVTSNPARLAGEMSPEYFAQGSAKAMDSFFRKLPEAEMAELERNGLLRIEPIDMNMGRGAAVVERALAKGEILYSHIRLLDGMASRTAYFGEKARLYDQIRRGEIQGFDELKVQREALAFAHRVSDFVHPMLTPAYSLHPLYQLMTFLNRSNIKESSQAMAMLGRGDWKGFTKYAVAKGGMTVAALAAVGLLTENGVPDEDRMKFFVKSLPLLNTMHRQRFQEGKYSWFPGVEIVGDQFAQLQKVAGELYAFGEVSDETMRRALPVFGRQIDDIKKVVELWSTDREQAEMYLQNLFVNISDKPPTEADKRVSIQKRALQKAAKEAGRAAVQ